MFEIDKRKFGAFVAQLRKEKGYTQKELADRLFLSDKAISKWETSVSIPDTTLLVPLAELLGVTVTELLMCARMEQPHAVEPEQVETLVKTAIAFSDEKPLRAYQEKDKKWMLVYLFALLVGGGALLLAYTNGQMIEQIGLLFVMSAIFGAYFCFFVQGRLPKYYDENRINAYTDGMFRMNLVGVAFDNTNWPHIVRACRTWICTAMAFLPVLCLLMGYTQIAWWAAVQPYALLLLFLGMLLLPIYIMGRKYGSK